MLLLKGKIPLSEKTNTFFLSKTNTFFLLRNTLDKVVALIWVMFQKVMHKLVIGNGSFRQNTNWFRFVINPRIYSDSKPGFVYGKNGILTRFCYALFIFIAYLCLLKLDIAKGGHTKVLLESNCLNQWLGKISEVSGFKEFLTVCK